MSYPYDYLFKLIIIGNAGTGKTSLCRKYVENVTTPYYDTTIGVEFFSKIITFDGDCDQLLLQNKKFKIHIWDTAGQECFRSIIKSYYRDVAGVFLVCDLTRRATLEDLKFWIKEIDTYGPAEKPEYTLLCNKKDMQNKYAIFYEDIVKFCEERNIKYKFTTYRDNSMSEAVDDMVSKIYTKYKTGPKHEIYPGIRTHSLVEESNKKRDLCSGYSRGKMDCCSIS